jgi:hypothetical protein
MSFYNFACCEIIPNYSTPNIMQFMGGTGLSVLGKHFSPELGRCFRSVEKTLTMTSKC